MINRNITFKILNQYNKIITIKAVTGDDDHLYRCGTPIYCSCQDPPTAYQLKDDKVYCPSCGKESLELTYHNNLLEDIHLKYYGKDYNTMQDLYKLSDTLPYNIWNTVADYFIKLKPSEIDLGYNVNYVGWVTSNPEAVENVLNINEELRIKNQTQLEPLILNNNPRLSEVDKFDIVDRLHEVFSVVETPYGEYQLYDPHGWHDYIVENPLFPPNPIGNGEFWMVKPEDDEIWYVRYNYRDGDDLRMNNILIDGQLKAIGKCITYDKDVEDLLIKLKNERGEKI